MPSSSKKQRNFMAAVAHNPAFAKKVGVPQSVGKDFNEADKGRKFGKGGTMKKYADGGIYTEKGMGAAPDEPDMGSSPAPRRPMPRRPAPMGRGVPPLPAARRPVPGKPRGIRGGVWTEDSGIPVPQNPESAPMKKGGMVKEGGAVPKGMHRMPDGKVMKNSDHMKGSVKESDMMARMGRGETKAKMQMRGMGMARGGKVCKMR